MFVRARVCVRVCCICTIYMHMHAHTVFVFIHYAIFYYGGFLCMLESILCPIKLLSALFLIYVYLYFNITEMNTLLVFKGECHYYIIIKLMLRVITVGKGYYFN
jgi:hypothetical protein